METGQLSIGEVAERTGLGVHTLRMYERDGLLAGEVKRSESGQRLYSAWDVEWLLNCVRFRASGMPLATIARLAGLVRAGSGNEAERLVLLREHQQYVHRRLAELHDSLAMIAGKVSAYEAHLAAGGSGDPWQALTLPASSRQ